MNAERYFTNFNKKLEDLSDEDMLAFRQITDYLSLLGKYFSICVVTYDSKFYNHHVNLTEIFLNATIGYSHELVVGIINAKDYLKTDKIQIITGYINEYYAKYC